MDLHLFQDRFIQPIPNASNDKDAATLPLWNLSQIDLPNTLIEASLLHYQCKKTYYHLPSPLYGNILFFLIILPHIQTHTSSASKRLTSFFLLSKQVIVSSPPIILFLHIYSPRCISFLFKLSVQKEGANKQLTSPDGCSISFSPSLQQFNFDNFSVAYL